MRQLITGKIRQNYTFPWADRIESKILPPLRYPRAHRPRFHLGLQLGGDEKSFEVEARIVGSV